MKEDPNLNVMFHQSFFLITLKLSVKRNVEMCLIMRIMDKINFCIPAL